MYQECKIIRSNPQLMDDIVISILDNDFKEFKKRICTIVDQEQLYQSVFKFPTVNDPFSSYKYVQDRLNGLLPIEDNSLLHIAAFANSLEIFQFCIIEIGIKIEVKNSKGYTPLFYAVAGNSVEVFTYILIHLTNGRQIVKDNQGYNLIRCAVQSQCSYILKVLMNYLDISKLTDEHLLDIAIGNKDIETTKILLDVLKVNNSDKTPLMIATVKSSENLDCVKLMLMNREDPNIFINGISAFYLACESGNKKLAMLIASYTKEFDLRYKNLKQKTCIHYLCKLGDYDVMNYVLKKGEIEVNSIDEFGNLGPVYLIDRVNDDNFIRIMDLLLQNGFDINKHENNAKPLIYSFIKGSVKKSIVILKYLILKGADLSLSYNNTETFGTMLKKIMKFRKMPELQNF